MVLRNSKFSVMGLAVMVLGLSACSPGQPIELTSSPPPLREDKFPDGFSLLDLGHALSKGAVDIFDPYSNTLDVPLPERKPLLRPLPFSLNPHYKPMDKDVSFYALTPPEEELGGELDVVEPEPLAPPVPLSDEVEGK